MGWEAILQLVIMIISMIMEYLGGGSFSAVLHERNAVHHVAQYECGEVFWLDEAKVADGKFQGTLGRTCEVEAVDGGGLVGLRRHLENQLHDSAAESGAVQTVYRDGASEQRFEVKLVVDGHGERSSLEGLTSIKTDGVTFLKNVFESTKTPTSGKGRYLSYVMDGVEVSSTLRQGWYRVQLQNRSEIRKPWYVSSSLFEREAKKAQEVKMQERTEQVLNDLADHL